MPTRYEMAQQAVAGYKLTGVPLVAFDGQKFIPAGKGDDIGVFFAIPLAKRYLHLSTEQNIDAVLLCWIVLPAVLGCTGLVLLLKRRLYRFAGIFAVCCVAAISGLLGDVYVIQSGIVIACIPWLLYIVSRAPSTLAYGIAFAVGIGSAISNVVRLNAGTPVLVFAVILFVFQLKGKAVAKALLLAALAIGYIIPTLYIDSAVHARDRFLAAANPGYRPVTTHHPLWHNIYVGMGFLSNDHGLKMRDEVAFREGQRVAPTAPVLSGAYERALRQQVFQLFRTDPAFVLFSLAAKAGVVLVLLVLCAGPGLLRAARYPKPWPVECSFWAAMLFSSLNGIVVWPNPKYLLGFIALCVLYGIVSLDWPVRLLGLPLPQVSLMPSCEHRNRELQDASAQTPCHVMPPKAHGVGPE